MVAQIRASWPKVRILLRADSGFAREALMAWCEANRVDYLFGLARNERLTAMIADDYGRRRIGGQSRQRQFIEEHIVDQRQLLRRRQIPKGPLGGREGKVRRALQ